MRRWLFISLMLAIVCSLFASIPVMKVLTSDGEHLFRVQEIDSVFFSRNADYLYVNYSGDKQTAFASAGVQEMTYGTVEEAQEISIVWNNDGTVTITNPMAADGVTVTANGADVLIESIYPDEVYYNLSGTSTDGSLKIYSDYKYQFTLLGLNLTNPNGPAINSQSKKKGTIKLQKGYQNTLTDGTTYTNIPADEDAKGCLFSEGQLVFKGKGQLTVNAHCKHGIASDDYIEAENGVLIINTTADAAKGMKANDYITISETADITINQSGSKVLENDDVSYCAGMKADSTITIAGGKVNITSSAEGGRGLNSDLGIIISGGELAIHMTGNGGMGSSDNERPGGGGGGPGGGGPGGGGPGGGGPGGGGPGGGGPGGDTTDDSNSFTSPCIKTDGFVTISGGTIDFTTTGIKGFGIKAYDRITMTDGTLMVNTSGQGAEGIESKTGIDFNGGRVYAYSRSDDAINCAGMITCNGAWVYAVSDGNDAIDSNYGKSGAITITDGVVIAISSTGSPEEGLDCDNNNYIKINGGYILSAGGAQGGGAGSTLSGVTQSYVVTGSYAINSGSYYSIEDNSGNVLFGFQAKTGIVSNRNSLSIISAPGMSKGSSYVIKSGSSAPTATSDNWNNYITLGGQSTATTSVKTFTTK